MYANTAWPRDSGSCHLQPAVKAGSPHLLSLTFLRQSFGVLLLSSNCGQLGWFHSVCPLVLWEDKRRGLSQKTGISGMGPRQCQKSPQGQVLASWATLRASVSKRPYMKVVWDCWVEDGRLGRGVSESHVKETVLLVMEESNLNVMPVADYL